MRGGLINLIALAVLAVLIWFGGGHFEWKTSTRVGLILGALAIWLGIFVYQRWRSIRTARLIEERLKEQASSHLAGASDVDKEAIADLQRRMSDAIAGLKNSNLGKAALAELPWYMIIGPPGSGKSTALTASGLEFPKLGDGLNGIQGVGGTRNCEWWFTSEGILLDTAGRYTSVDEDREEWLAFLDMIKGARSRTPINGAIVAISVPELLSASEAELEAHAKSVRERLNELCQRLETVFPVYLMFTKCDLLTGFVDFFEDLGRSEREQVWGYTFRFQPESGERYRQVFRREAKELFARLSRKRLSLLATERPPEKQRRVFAFPLQLAAAEERLATFLGKVFAENPFKESAILRGFYFTSGTQEGKAIDQVLGAMKDAFGLQPKEAAVGEAPEAALEKKSYFLTTLFRSLIFKDKSLARSLASTEKRRRLVHLGAIAGAAAAALLLSIALLISYVGNASLINRVSVGVKAVNDARDDPNMPPQKRLDQLELLREAVAELDAHERDWPPLSLRWGLYSGSALFPKARSLYYAELREVLLTPAKAAIEAEMAEWIAPRADAKALKARYGYKHDQELYDGLYRLLRAYLMLSGVLEIKGDDALDIEEQLKERNRWLRGLKVGPEDPAGEREAAWKQLRLICKQADYVHEWGIEADEALVHRVRQKLEANYWVSQSYTQIRDTRMDQAGFDSTASLFGEAAAVFAPVTSVSKVFTLSEWNDYFEKAVKEKSAYLAAQYKELRNPKTEEEIEGELRKHYLDEGASRWHRFLRELHVEGFAGAEDAVAKLQLLGSPKSPLPLLFDEVWLRRHVLSIEAEKAKLIQRPPPKIDKRDDSAVGSWHTQAQNVFAKLAIAVDKLAKEPAGRRIYPRAASNKLSELDFLRDAFSEAQQEITHYVVPQTPVTQEGFAKRILLEVIEAARLGIEREAQRETDAAWVGTVQASYTEKFSARFPFRPDAKDEAPIDDFVAILTPRTGTLWKARAAHEALLSYTVGGKGLIGAGLRYRESLKDAERLRDALFTKGKLALLLRVKPRKREKVANVRFSLGKDSVKDSDLPPTQRKDMTWGADRGAKVSMLGVDQKEWALIDYGNSAWGLVRLLASGTLDEEASKDRRYRYTWRYELGGEERLADVEFEVDKEEAEALFKRTLFLKHTPPPPSTAK